MSVPSMFVFTQCLQRTNLTVVFFPDWVTFELDLYNASWQFLHKYRKKRYFPLTNFHKFFADTAFFFLDGVSLSSSEEDPSSALDSVAESSTCFFSTFFSCLRFRLSCLTESSSPSAFTMSDSQSAGIFWIEQSKEGQVV